MILHNGNEELELFFQVFTQRGSHKDPMIPCIHYYTEDKKINGYFECHIDDFPDMNSDRGIYITYLYNPYEECPISILTKSQLIEVDKFMRKGGNFKRIVDVWFECVDKVLEKDVDKNKSY